MSFVFEEVDGVKIINTTPHAIRFSVGTDQVQEVPPCGTLLNAKPVEVPAGERPGISLVKTTFQGSPEGIVFLNTIPPEVVVVGSIVAAQAYPGRCFAMIPAKGFERVPTEQKRMDPHKFTTF